jgi:hypothetical protein
MYFITDTLNFALSLLWIVTLGGKLLNIFMLSVECTFLKISYGMHKT